ncbi:hypothetical protein JX266_007010 [Neoarthrinium moseri]|nr:hypothetical protein JX266_007010 [Neoarthrinium moseri]
MTGSTLTWTASPTVESPPPHSFRRPHSTPEIAPAQQSQTTSPPDHHRSLSQQTPPTFDFDVSSLDFDGTGFDLTLPVAKTLRPSSNEKSTPAEPATHSEGARPRTGKMGRRKSILGRPQSWMPTPKATLDAGQYLEEKTSVPTESVSVLNGKGAVDGSKLLQPPDHARTASVSGSLASFARRSWISTSRTPSPSANDHTEAADYVSHETRERSPSTSSSKTKLKRLSRKRQSSNADSLESKSSDSLTKLGSVFGKMKARPQPAMVKGVLNHDTESTSSSVASLAPASTTTRPSNAASENTFTSVPDDLAKSSSSAPIRDPLWSVFKSLESEYSKFQSKKPAEKMKLVRSALMPFLRNYSSHPSDKRLSPEQVEQRAEILNKWWTGLLELFDGSSQQSVPGTDRPTLHEVTTLVMMRPEWRLCTPCFRPLSERGSRETTKKKGRARAETLSDESSSPMDSDYIAESAEHNVRNMFTVNLVRQMAIVVDKLSLRYSPLSLVNFAGKACAYAFFFAPGIADVLVRLWALTPDLIRRVADEFRLPRRSQRQDDNVTASFPPALSALAWTSVRDMSSSLRQAAKLPLAAAKIAWHGPWISRWRGRDTDLFFIFSKYYFMLAEEFVPADMPLAEKGCGPAFLLVNAQILANLDSTVHRQAAVNAMMMPLADGLGADASATALPIVPNNNVMKGMSENRLIVLLKDFLSASSVTLTAPRHTFAEAFMALMKASAKRTSLFDHNACFTLCDFLEETLVAYDGYVDVHRPTLEYIDWPFWLDVCKKIMQSNNTMSEVRVLSLIFSIWDAIASNQSRKEVICFDWLLKEEIFYKWFNNWCPMVRAYYMRLLCWRICRDTGSANDLDAKIFVTVATRLKTVWSHYLWLRQDTESKCKLPPSTAPSYPTPGKRFMIIRTEVPATQPGMMMGFDAFSTPVGAPDTNSAVPTTFTELLPATEDQPVHHKKKWNVFGKVISFGGSSNTNDLESLRRETAAARKPPPPPKHITDTVTPPASDSDSLGSAPTYEAMQFIFRFTLSWNAPNSIPPPNRILTRPRLPTPAQSWVNAKLKKLDGGVALPPAGRPAPTRAVSGSVSTGLIEEAKNANSSEVSPTLPRISTNFHRRDSAGPKSPQTNKSSDEEQQYFSPMTPTSEPVVQPTQPQGVFAQPSTYAGRALAEWSLIVAECNSFVDRRRDEGVLGLSEVEVPSLGVEGFRKIG